MANNNLHFWVMSFERNFKDVFFWEPMTNKKYVLRNRVTYPDILKKYFKMGFEKEEELQVELKKRRRKRDIKMEDDKSILTYLKRNRGPWKENN